MNSIWASSIMNIICGNGFFSRDYVQISKPRREWLGCLVVVLEKVLYITYLLR